MSKPSERKRVLVTGGAGYIGSHIVLCLLLTQQYHVTVIDNYYNSFPESLKRVEQIARDELKSGKADETSNGLTGDLDGVPIDVTIDVIEGDIRKKDDLNSLFERYSGKGGVFAVIHCAALKAVGESGEIPNEYYETNVGATISLLQIMHAHKCTRFVYSSSATVYGCPPTIPIPETCRISAESVYGRTKAMCEDIIRDLCLAHSKANMWKAISLRYFNPAGAHPSGLIGEDPRGRPNNLLPLLARLAIGKYASEGGLKIFGDDYPTPDGTCLRDYIHVLDLAQGHVLALMALDNPSIVRKGDHGFRPFNLGTGKPQSVWEMVRAMEKATGVKVKTTVIGRRAGDVPDLTADPKYAQETLGFTAPRDLETMCRDLWNWQTKNPEGYGGQ